MSKDTLKPWEEQAVRAYMENGGNQRQAYITAKPIAAKWKESTVDSKASVLFATGKVKERLAELRQSTQERTQITADWITRQLKEGLQMAIEDRNHAGINSYLDKLARHIGFFEADNAQKTPRQLLDEKLQGVSPEILEQIHTRLERIAGGTVH